MPPPNPAPNPPQPPGAFALPAKPAAMRQSAWEFLFKFTKKHEGYVPHMFAGDPIKTQAGPTRDVTCGMGFALFSPASATLPEIKVMFYNPATGQPPSDPELMADWNAANAIPREWTKEGMKKYENACKLRMHPNKIYERWGNILRNQKLPTALSKFPDDYKDFQNYPAAAQAMLASFWYGNDSTLFKDMRAEFKVSNFGEASKHCKLLGMKGTKNEAHRDLLLFAQQIVDEQRNFDEVPSV